MTIREGNEMNITITKSALFGAASLLAALLLAGPALADGMPAKGKPVAAPDAYDPRPCSVSGYVGASTDNVYRGISKSNEDPSAEGAVDLTCGRFYLGVSGAGVAGASGTEFDIYGGYRFSTGPLNWDLGVIYYAFSGADDANFIELKAAASGTVWQGGTLGGAVFYAPDYFGDGGNVWTIEGRFAQALPKVDRFSPTFSAAVGHLYFTDSGFDVFDYTYWNAGVTFAFLERWSLDLRYWDTDNDGLAKVLGELADERFVATVKYKF
jgi:uncharacterized protein (TIGR02001 family)